MSKRMMFHGAAILVLLASVAFAQSTSKPAESKSDKSSQLGWSEDGPNVTASGRRSVAIVAPGRSADAFTGTVAMRSAAKGKYGHEVSAKQTGSAEARRGSAHDLGNPD